MTILGKVSPAVTTDVLAYVCPVATKASLNISATNRLSADTNVTISLSKADDLGVAAITVTDGGTGLTAIPTLTIAGTGTGATATVASIKMTAATIAAGGTGYVVGDVVTVSGGTGTAATYTVQAVDANGAVTSGSITAGGVYTAVITGTTTGVTGGTGTGLTFTVSTIRYGINAVTVTEAGNNFTSAPTVTPSAGTGAVFNVQMTRAAIEANDAVEYQVTIPAKGVLERTGIVLGAGDAVFVKSSVANSTNFFVFGVQAIA